MRILIIEKKIYNFYDIIEAEIYLDWLETDPTNIFNISYKSSLEIIAHFFQKTGLKRVKFDPEINYQSYVSGRKTVIYLKMKIPMTDLNEISSYSKN